MSPNDVVRHFFSLLSLLQDPAFTAVFGAIIAGAGTLYAARLTSKDNNKVIKVDESTALRIELRNEIDKLRAALAAERISGDEWREKYYALVDKYNVALNRARIAEADLKEALEELERLRPPNRQH